MVGSWGRTFLCALAGIVLVGCSETQLAVHSAKRLISTPEDKAPTTYKIGKPYQIAGVWYYPQEDFEYDFIKCVDWCEDTEVKNIQDFDIGIMPLPNSSFEKGKCGYKLIQYMACGIPVVGSSVGENNIIIDHSENGYLADLNEDWSDFLIQLISNKTLRYNFGQKGLKKINQNYTILSQGPKLLETIKKVNETV